MKEYFFESLGRGIGNPVYNVIGGVMITAPMYHDEETGKDMIAIIIYDLPSHLIQAMDDEERDTHEILDKRYSMDGMNFNDETMVYAKLHEIISDIEREVYSM